MNALRRRTLLLFLLTNVPPLTVYCLVQNLVFLRHLDTDRGGWSYHIIYMAAFEFVFMYSSSYTMMMFSSRLIQQSINKKV